MGQDNRSRGDRRNLNDEFQDIASLLKDIELSIDELHRDSLSEISLRLESVSDSISSSEIQRHDDLRELQKEIKQLQASQEQLVTEQSRTADALERIADSLEE